MFACDEEAESRLSRDAEVVPARRAGVGRFRGYVIARDENDKYPTAALRGLRPAAFPGERY